MFLYHYFEKSKGPFLSIMDLPHEQAIETLGQIQERNVNLVNPRKHWFLNTRRGLEKKVRDLFVEKGGKPERTSPYYMTLGECDAMKTWYEDPGVIRISVSEFNPKTVSFTYGDMLPVFNPELDEGEEFRANVYLYGEILQVIERHGLPEEPDYNLREGIYPQGAPIFHFLKYVEAHIWSDEVVQRYR